MLRRPGNPNSTAAEDLLLMEVSFAMATQGTHCLLPEDRVRGLLGFCEMTAARDMKLEHIRDLNRLYTLFR